jgi:hypothetical protein
MRCDIYADDGVFTAIQKGIDMLGGISQLTRADEKPVIDKAKMHLLQYVRYYVTCPAKGY